jgi:hypothetical protein
LLGTKGALVVRWAVVIEVSWIVLGFGEILWGDSKLKGTTFYVDRLSPIATMQVMPTFA